MEATARCEDEGLATTEDHIAEFKRQVRAQQDRVDRLLAGGLDAARGQALLAALKDGLAILERHRDAIVERIAALEGALGSPGAPGRSEPVAHALAR